MSETYVTVCEICARFDLKTEPWATADLAEEIECTVNRAMIDLPGDSFDRWLRSLNLRDSRDLDYDSPARIEAFLKEHAQ